MYEIQFSTHAARYFKKIKEKQLKKTYETTLLKLKSDPYIGTPKRGNLSGIYGYDVKYQGINYEIAYTIHETNGKKIVVLLVGTRENFYEQLRRYVK